MRYKSLSSILIGIIENDDLKSGEFSVCAANDCDCMEGDILILDGVTEENIGDALRTVAKWRTQISNMNKFAVLVTSQQFSLGQNNREIWPKVVEFESNLFSLEDYLNIVKNKEFVIAHREALGWNMLAENFEYNEDDTVTAVRAKI